MAKKKTPARKTVKARASARSHTKQNARKTPAKTKRAATRSKPGAVPASLLAPVRGATHREIGSVNLDIARAGAARVKRVIYPAGFRWSADLKPIIGTPLCEHAHVGFLAHGEIHVEYADGCIVEQKAPQVIAIEPGHDAWVVGPDPVVLIEFDFEGDTIARLGMPAEHRHSS